MDRADAADYLGERFANYLAFVERSATDTTGNLKPVIDDALRILGYGDDLAVASSADDEVAEDWRVQLDYRLLRQVLRDLGTLAINISTGGESFGLQQVRASAERDLAIAEAAVLARFGTLGTVTTSDVFGVTTLTLNINDDRYPYEDAG